MKRYMWAVILVSTLVSGLDGIGSAQRAAGVVAAAPHTRVVTDGSCTHPSCVHPNG